jgi:hypothetical protein
MYISIYVLERETFKTKPDENKKCNTHDLVFFALESSPAALDLSNSAAAAASSTYT